MKALVFLPVLNEAESLVRVVASIRATGHEPVLSDAGSTDGTIRIAKEMGLRLFIRSSPGKGVGFREMLQVAKNEGCEVLLMMDCDGTYPAEKIPLLLSKIPEYDMVSGARDFRSMPMANRWANRFYIFLIRLLYGYRFQDAHSGFRALKLAMFDGLTDAEHFDLEPQLCCLALKRGMKILEIPISYHERIGKSKVRMKDAYLVFRMIVRERFRR